MEASVKTRVANETGRSRAKPVATPSSARRLETLDLSERTMRAAANRADRSLRQVGIVLVAMVIMCLAMAVVVWWRLLT